MSQYTDVDRLILERWNDVRDLQDAFKELTDRMRSTIGGVLARTERWLDEQGYRCDCDPRTPEISAWKPAWEAKRGQPAVRLVVGEFAPHGYGKVRSAHPFLWVMTANLDLLKMKEPERVAFGRQLRQSLGAGASKWDHHEVSDADSPLGRYITDLSEDDRVALAAEPHKMVALIQDAFAELFEMSSAIDHTLAAARSSRA